MSTQDILSVVIVLLAVLSLVMIKKHGDAKKEVKSINFAFSNLVKQNESIEKRVTGYTKDLETLRNKYNTQVKLIPAVISDLDEYRKVAKGFEVAGIKKSIKIIKDHCDIA